MEKNINIIGVPSDFGANTAGSCMGPDALRTAGINYCLKNDNTSIEDWGNIQVPIKYALDTSKKTASYLPVIQDICIKLKELVAYSFEKGNIPLCLGGDHSISIGSLAGLVKANRSKNIGLIWIDTHADLNTPQSSTTQNIHGMPISVLFNKGYPELTNIIGNQKTIKEENVAIIGLRDVDPIEREFLQKSKINYFTMRDLDERGIQSIMKEVNKSIVSKVDGLHVSFDLDAMDPLQIPGVSTPVAGGLSLREAHLLLEILHETNKVISADFVELNPFNDERGQSAKMAVELISSLFGKRII